MYQREAEKTLKELSKFYPVVSITGPRQSGKTTLTKLVFPENDPRKFLTQSKTGLIIDEVQNCPELFSYIQGIVDKNKEQGDFILTGSQQFGLMSGISQSLAGRMGMLELLPFSIKEVSQN